MGYEVIRYEYPVGARHNYGDLETGRNTWSI